MLLVISAFEQKHVMSNDIHLFAKPIALDSIAEPWIDAYRKNRYLRTLTDAELEERTVDIFSNLMQLGDDRQYRPQLHVPEDQIYSPIRNLDFLRMTTEVWEEMKLRGKLCSKLQDNKRLQMASRLADESWCYRPDWIENSRISKDNYQTPRMLFRFSNPERNNDFIKEGKICISPASSHKDETLNNAVRDDELCAVTYDQKLTKNETTVDDYYCFCVSSEYDYRLYGDFESKSCVAIRNPKKFTELMRKTIQQHNDSNPQTRIVSLRTCPIFYYDPFKLNTPKEAFEIWFSKHFRFAYQTEFRYVLIPERVDSPLQRFFLNLGNIEDIAELVFKGSEH